MRALAAISLAVAVAPVLAACAGPGWLTSVPALTQASWSTVRATPGYDTSERTQTDPAQLERLRVILDDHDVTGDVESNPDGCPDSRSLTIRAALADGRQWTIHRAESCTADDQLADELFALVDDWEAHR